MAAFFNEKVRCHVNVEENFWEMILRTYKKKYEVQPSRKHNIKRNESVVDTLLNPAQALASSVKYKHSYRSDARKKYKPRTEPKYKSTN